MVRIISRFRKSLSFKLTALAWLVAISGSMLFSAIQIYIEFQSEKQKLLSIIPSIENGYSDSLSDSVWNYDSRQINIQMNAINQVEGVRYLMLTDEANRLLYLSGERDINNLDPRHIKSISLYRSGENTNIQKIATLEIQVDIAKLYITFRNKALFIFILSTMQVTLVILFLYLIFKTLLINPIRSISHELKHSHFDVSEKLSSYTIKHNTVTDFNEIDILVDTINHLKKSVVEHIHEMKLNNDILEARVIARTRDLKTQNDNLHSALEQIKAIKNRLVTQEKLAALGKLTSGLQHEFKNPINFIVNYGALLQDTILNIQSTVQSMHEVSKERRDVIADELITMKSTTSVIQKHAARLDSIVKQMGYISVNETKTSETFSISELMRNNAKIAIESANAKNNKPIRFEQNFNSKQLIDGNPGEFVTLCNNLIDNSIWAISKKMQSNNEFTPCIRIEVKDLNESISIEVYDNGIGIPQEHIDSISNPFFTLKSPGEGVGLGLTYVHDIVVKHSGTIDIVSSEHEFTKVIITIPAKMVSEVA